MSGIIFALMLLIDFITVAEVFRDMCPREV